MKYEKLTKLSIRNHPGLSERWVQERIADDPAILGLGDVILKDKERIQPAACRLDLLLREPTSTSSTTTNAGAATRSGSRRETSPSTPTSSAGCSTRATGNSAAEKADRRRRRRRLPPVLPRRPH